MQGDHDAVGKHHPHMTIVLVLGVRKGQKGAGPRKATAGKR